MKRKKRSIWKALTAALLVLTLVMGAIPGGLLGTMVSEAADTPVSLELDQRNGNAGGFFCSSSANDTLNSSAGWDVRYTGCVYVGGELQQNVPLIKILSNLYYVGLADAGLSALPNTVVKISGRVSDGTHEVTFEDTSFQFRSDNKWYVAESTPEEPEEPDKMAITVDNRAGADAGGFYFTTASADGLRHSEAWNVRYTGCVYVDGAKKDNVPLIKILSNLYYVALSDVGITATVDETVVKIDGTITDGTNSVTFEPTNFKFGGATTKWYTDKAAEEIQTVTITKDGRSNTSGKNGFYFITSPADSLVCSAGGWDKYFGSCVYVNGTLHEEVPVFKVTSTLYYVGLVDAGLSAEVGTTIMVKGILTDGTHKVDFKEEEFTYVEDGRWLTQEEMPRPVTSVAISNDPSRNTTKQKGIYFIISPEDSLKYWGKYFGSCVSVDGVLKENIPVCKEAANLYYVALPDVGITPAEGMEVKIEGTLTDGTSDVEFLPATFIYKNGKWVLDGTIESMDLNSAIVKVYDIYELEKISTITIPKGEYYNLTNLKMKSNVGLKMQVRSLTAVTDFTLSKMTANNVWVDSGYLIRVNPDGGSIEIYVDGFNKKVASVSGLDLKEPYVLEYGVADMYPASGGTEAIARRVYIKVNDDEVLNWLDDNMDRPLGTYVPARSDDEAVIGSVDFEGYEVLNCTPAVQDISELMDDLSTFTTSPGREVKVGSAQSATNNGIRMKVKWDAPVKEDGDELLLSFSNNSDAGIWVQEDGGYNVLITKYGIDVRHCNDDSLKASVSCEIPQDEFLFEIGTYDQNVVKNGKKVEAYSKVVYVKIDGKEILTFTDKNVKRSLGKNLWVYTSKNVKANLISLTSTRFLVKDKVAVNDLFDAMRLSKKTLPSGKETALGQLSSSRNVAFKTRVKLDKDCEELFFGISKVDKEKYWDAEESGWQFWLKPKNQQIFIVHGGVEAGAVRAFPITEEFIMEIGERDVYYNNGEAYCREVYIAIDGEIALTFADKDTSRPLGTYMHALVTGGHDVVLESLTTTGYVPVEKLPEATDLFDASGYASVSLEEGLTYLGEVGSNKNSAIRMKVDVNADAEEFGISFGKAVKNTITEDVKDEGVSGWNIWIKPKWKLVDITYGYYQKGATANFDIPESFILEVGSRDVYYENGKYYGYEVYVKIDDKIAASWLDEGIEKRTVGTHVLSYVNPNANAKVKLTTLYPATTLPVEYVVNGETRSEVESVTSNTTVVTGKPSKIRVKTSRHPEYNLYNEGVIVAGQEVTALELEDSPKGVYTYEVTANQGDKVIVNLKRTELKVNEPAETLDMSEISGLASVSVEGLKNGPVGNMIKDGDLQRTDSAFRFKVELPKSGGAVRWGMYSDQDTCWGCNGFLLSLTPGRALIYSVGYDVLASEKSDILTPGTMLYVEGGMVKCYEDGNYKYNRFYVKAGTSVDNMEMLCWYDSRERGGFGTAISFVGMDYEESYTIYSTSQTYTLTDESMQQEKDKLGTYVAFDETKVAAYYPEQVLAYSDSATTANPACIKLYPKEGMKLASLIVAGNDVTDSVMTAADGGYVYTLPSMQQNISFSYAFTEE